MAKQYVWMAIAGGVFAAGIGVGYGIFGSSSHDPTTVSQQQMLQYMQQNPEAANRWMDAIMQSQTGREQMAGYMTQNPQYMWAVMSDPEIQEQMYANREIMQKMMVDPQFQSQMFEYMRQDQQYHYGMMGGMMGDSALRHQMMDYLGQDQQFRDGLMSRWNSTGMGGLMMGQ